MSKDKRVPPPSVICRIRRPDARRGRWWSLNVAFEEFYFLIVCIDAIHQEPRWGKHRKSCSVCRLAVWRLRVSGRHSDCFLWSSSSCSEELTQVMMMTIIILTLCWSGFASVTVQNNPSLSHTAPLSKTTFFWLAGPCKQQVWTSDGWSLSVWHHTDARVEKTVMNVFRPAGARQESCDRKWGERGE